MRSTLAALQAEHEQITIQLHNVEATKNSLADEANAAKAESDALKQQLESLQSIQSELTEKVQSLEAQLVNHEQDEAVQKVNEIYLTCLSNESKTIWFRF